MSMSKPSRSPENGLRNPKSSVSAETPAIRWPRFLILFMNGSFGMTPGTRFVVSGANDVTAVFGVLNGPVHAGAGALGAAGVVVALATAAGFGVDALVLHRLRPRDDVNSGKIGFGDLHLRFHTEGIECVAYDPLDALPYHGVVFFPRHEHQARVKPSERVAAQ